jgi:ADP-ribosylglycohydrolase/catechol 2,3-dioxygenase-like lactoylglutathione lyase family enzyme
VSEQSALEIIDLSARSHGAMLAAAVGDALGWPQENRGRRVGGRRGVETKLEFVDWHRRDGGRYASHEDLIRAGEYSDDTQLVLAVARSLAAGNEWWERWTGVELPFWLLYERGGGGATKRAARSWSRGTEPWTREERSRYFAAGGNGVAMRVLPHCIRGATGGDFAPIARSVFADGIATHGHPRAHVGALAYAFALWRALRREDRLAYGALVDEVAQGAGAWSGLPDVDKIPGGWRQTADEQFTGGFERIWDDTVAEVLELLSICAHGIEQGALSVDHEILDQLGCFDSKISGAGTVTAAGAIFIASRYASRPTQGLLAAAFARGADSDTLAAMAGALLGAVNGPDWLGRATERLQDHEYLTHATGALLRGQDGVVGPAPEPPSLSRFWRGLADIGVGTDLDLPDGRRGAVREVVDHSTRTRNSIKTWVVETSDGQTLFLKKVRKLSPAEPTTPSVEVEVPQSDARGRRAVVAVEAANLEQSLSFYRDIVGLEVRRQTPDYVNFGGVVLVLPASCDRMDVASSQLSLSEDVFAATPRIMVFVEASELEALRDRIAAIKLPVSTIEERGGRQRFQCLDPDGTVIELREANGS